MKYLGKGIHTAAANSYHMNMFFIFQNIIIKFSNKVIQKFHLS